ncbi:hypothetical protein PDJAM_G00106030 [Pangasius djambal]|uniref:Uncharacterized protein n=1 Tax=Pangasius djambal TaxID=1691987 RepID=A0ACC5Y1C8_9TELE|nr:hypothetical protein [Pangasius djambal]
MQTDTAENGVIVSLATLAALRRGLCDCVWGTARCRSTEDAHSRHGVSPIPFPCLRAPSVQHLVSGASEWSPTHQHTTVSEGV